MITSNTFYEFNEKTYRLNVSAIIDFITKNRSNETLEITTSKSYDIIDKLTEPKLNGQVVQETLKNTDRQIDNIKYDFIKLIFSYLFENVSELSQTVMMNTLIFEGFLVEIENTQNN